MEGHKIFSKPPEYYSKIHEEAVLAAIDWQENETNVRKVLVPEPGIEDHFENNWGMDDTNYRSQIHKWRGDGRLANLTLIAHEDSDTRSFVVDTSDLVMGLPTDEYFFVQIGTCWGIVIDLEVDGQDRRVAYHMPGITTTKDVSLDELLKQLDKVGQVGNLNIFYGGREYPEPEITDFKQKFGGRSINLMNLDEKVEWGARDIIVKGNSAKQYFNKGLYSETGEEPRVERVFAGEWALK